MQCTRRKLLSISLFVAIAAFIRNALYLASLTSSVGIDESLFIAPIETIQGHGRHETSHDPTNEDDFSLNEQTSFFSTSAWPSDEESSPYDPRSKPLPDHPTPNIDLRDLVGSMNKPYPCPRGLEYVTDHPLPDHFTYPRNEDGTFQRKIPRILHFTMKSRCMSPDFVEIMRTWRNRLGNKYSIYIHDDEAVDKLLYMRRWEEFPELKEVLGCVSSGASKADIWRYIVIWEYGGIYSDFDSAPNQFGIDSIAPEDDAFFPLEAIGIPAQYFFAASPRHPVMYLSAKHALRMMAFRQDLARTKPEMTTGPGAFKTGFMLFQNFGGYEADGYATEGVYPGFGGRTVRVVGKKGLPKQWILREAVGDKETLYKVMNMTHFHKTEGKFRMMYEKDISCLDHRWGMHMGSSSWNLIV
ncbi:hypothetical protein ACHAXS_001356 [Conticribra weissflogii]